MSFFLFFLLSLIVMTEVEVEVVVVRHGETDSNRLHTIQGHLDTPLSSVGLRQAESVAAYLAETKFSLAISSDLKRALLTGQIIARANASLEESEIEQWGVLRERCFGELEGGEAQVMQEVVRGLNRDQILAWGPQGGETGLEFRQRVRKLSSQIISLTQHFGLNVNQCFNHAEINPTCLGEEWKV